MCTPLTQSEPVCAPARAQVSHERRDGGRRERHDSGCQESPVAQLLCAGRPPCARARAALRAHMRATRLSAHPPTHARTHARTLTHSHAARAQAGVVALILIRMSRALILISSAAQPPSPPPPATVSVAAAAASRRRRRHQFQPPLPPPPLEPPPPLPPTSAINRDHLRSLRPHPWRGDIQTHVVSMDTLCVRSVVNTRVILSADASIAGPCGWIVRPL